jgi:NAD(P)-dependent dehydrogenase (short-subunit alcohol dehydrogenase family)
MLHVSWTEWKNLFSLEVYCRTAKLQVEGLVRSYGPQRLRIYRWVPSSARPSSRRSPTRTRTSRGRPSGSTSPDQRVLGELADVSSPEDVERLVRTAVTGLDELTILVSNAGVYGPKGTIHTVSWAEWARAIEINLFGSVLPARALAGRFARRGYGKIMQLSGGGATKPMPSDSAPMRHPRPQSCDLPRRWPASFSSMASTSTRSRPGALNTRMLDEVLEAGPHRIEPAYYERALQQQKSGGVPLARGAALAVFLGSAGSDGISGKLISAVWDPWTELSEHRDDLSGDVYTLRRIIPADRGLGWGDA